MTKKVYIVGPYKQAYASMFVQKGGFVGVLDIESADIVVFTGGADIDPSMYNEQPLQSTIMSTSRDVEDLDAWALSGDKIKVGICRGAQFLNVMNGGQLWQDVDKHTTPHFVQLVGSDRRVWCTSTHHQMMIPNYDDATLIGYAALATGKYGDHRNWKRTTASPCLFSTLEVCGDRNAMDWEVVWYKDTSSLCFQPHPEHLNQGDCRQFFFQQLGVAIAAHYARKAA